MASLWNFLGDAAAAASIPFGPCAFCTLNGPAVTLGEDIPEYDIVIPPFVSTAAVLLAAYPPFNEFAAPEAANEPPVMLEMSRYETDELLLRFVAVPTKVAMEVDM